MADGLYIVKDFVTAPLASARESYTSSRLPLDHWDNVEKIMPRTSTSDLHHRVRSVTVLAAGLLTSLAVFVVAPSRADQPAAKPFTRDEATAIIANARKIVTPNGVERLEKVRIGGIEQWVSIRGANRRNPVLLYIHGGPGYVSIPMSWWFSRGWEEYFTVVQWDQRAAGKTYLLNDPATIVPAAIVPTSIAPTLTPERMIADAEEMATWARKEFGKDKIFVLGHSWGSFLGLQLATVTPNGCTLILAFANSSTDLRASVEAGVSPWTARGARAMPRPCTSSRQSPLRRPRPHGPHQGPLRSTQMGRFLWWHYGLSARQFGRQRARPALP